MVQVSAAVQIVDASFADPDVAGHLDSGKDLDQHVQDGRQVAGAPAAGDRRAAGGAAAPAVGAAQRASRVLPAR